MRLSVPSKMKEYTEANIEHFYQGVESMIGHIFET